MRGFNSLPFDRDDPTQLPDKTFSPNLRMYVFHDPYDHQLKIKNTYNDMILKELPKEFSNNVDRFLFIENDTLELVYKDGLLIHLNLDTL